MADYYPLIARAVLALKDARAEERAPVYERARNALINHLRNIQPPVGPDALAAEEQALDLAIARVEAEILSGDVPGNDRTVYIPKAPADPVVTDAGAAAPPLPRVDDAPPVSTSSRPAVPNASPVAGHNAPAGRKRQLAAAALAVVGALAVAALAYGTRSDPTVVARTDPGPVAPAQTAPPQPAKTGERVGDAGPVATTPPAQPDASPAQPALPVLPVAQRAILYEEQPDSPGKPAEVTGRAIWRLDTVSAGSGQPPETVIRIDLEFPERSFNTEMTIRRNLDQALSASHLIEIKFSFRAGGGSVRELATPPQMKQEENQRGSPLIALQVPVMENFFLVGLSKLPADVERNVALLESANWIDLPVRFANGRIAVIAFEKGTNGADVLNAALVRWRSS